jgi:hypothetical protein
MVSWYVAHVFIIIIIIIITNTLYTHFKQVNVGEEDWSRKVKFPKPVVYFVTSRVKRGYNVIKREKINVSL